MAAEGHGFFEGRRHALGLDDLDFERLLEDQGHEIRVERPPASRGVGLLDVFADIPRAADDDLASALGPQEHFDQPVRVQGVVRGPGMSGGQDPGFKCRPRSVPLLDSQDQGRALRGGQDRFPEAPVP